MNEDGPKTDLEDGFLGGYNSSLHDVSESIPEDDEDYSSTDCTYYSEELDAIFNRNKNASSASSSGGSISTDDDDDDEFFGLQNEDGSFPTSNRFRTGRHNDASSSFQTQSDTAKDDPENFEDSFANNNPFRRDPGSQKRDIDQESSSASNESSSYDSSAEKDNETEKSNLLQDSVPVERKSVSSREEEKDPPTTQNNPQILSKERLVSDGEDSDHDDDDDNSNISSSSSEEKTSLSDHDSGQPEAQTRLEFSQEWASFGGNAFEADPSQTATAPMATTSQSFEQSDSEVSSGEGSSGPQEDAQSVDSSSHDSRSSSDSTSSKDSESQTTTTNSIPVHQSTEESPDSESSGSEAENPDSFDYVQSETNNSSDRESNSSLLGHFSKDHTSSNPASGEKVGDSVQDVTSKPTILDDDSEQSSHFTAIKEALTRTGGIESAPLLELNRSSDASTVAAEESKKESVPPKEANVFFPVSFEDPSNDMWAAKKSEHSGSSEVELLKGDHGEERELDIFDSVNTGASASTNYSGIQSFQDADENEQFKPSVSDQDTNSWDSRSDNSEVEALKGNEGEEDELGIFDSTNSSYSGIKSFEDADENEEFQLASSDQDDESWNSEEDNVETTVDVKFGSEETHEMNTFEDESWDPEFDPSTFESDSSFHGSELSKSLHPDAEQLLNSNESQEDSESQGDTTNSGVNDDQSASEGNPSQTLELTVDRKSESSEAPFGASEVVEQQPDNEHDDDDEGSSYSNSSNRESNVWLQQNARKSQPYTDEASQYSSASSFDSHEDFRSRSRNKRSIDISFNSAFDMSKSDLGSFDLSARDMDASAHKSLLSEPAVHPSEGSEPLLMTEPDEDRNTSSLEFGTSSDQGEQSSSHEEDGEAETGAASRSSSTSTPTSSKSSQVGMDQKESAQTNNTKQNEELENPDSPTFHEAGENSEVSMVIGDVFKQPKELLGDDDENDLSSKSEGLIENPLDTKDQEAPVISELKNEVVSNESPSERPKNELQIEKNRSDKNSKRDKSTKSISEKERRKKKRRRKERNKRIREAKSPALMDFAANVNDAILDLEERSESEQVTDFPAYSLLHGFDALLGTFLQLSDEFELISTFTELNSKDESSMMHVSALRAILDFAETFDQLFSDLKPIIFDCFDEADEYIDDLFDRLDALVDLVCETTLKVGERQEWNCRAETTYVTLLELIERDSLDLRCYFDDVETPDPGISANVHEAWSATGHIEELRALQLNNDPTIFRQICYEVMVSTDQWCPDKETLIEICDIDREMFKEESPYEHVGDDEIAPIPQAAENVLDKVNGELLSRMDDFASVLRRLLPPHAVTDPSLRRHFTSMRHLINSPLGLSVTNVVSISSVPESINDPDALGVAGVGKTTLAAMVAEHPDVRRHFIDGVAWVYLGDEELNYNRYTQCLRELVAQLDFYDGIPLFAELLHTPGESSSKRKRREEGFMIYARDTVAGLLEDRSVLIILDDVCFEPDMDWFDFAPMPDESTRTSGENCALVITTRKRSLLPPADTVEIDMLDEVDAIMLLIQESGQLSHTLMAESQEAKSVVRECANHPLAVKSIGRWLNLKHATAGAAVGVEEIHSEVAKSMNKILKGGDNAGTDMMYEILSTSLSPAINGGPTNIIKFCFAAFIMVFCDRNHISDFELTEPTPIIPMDMAELLFQTLLEMYEVSLLKKGSLFYAQKKEAAVLIPEALSALGVLKVITYSDGEEEETNEEQKFLQVMHSIHHEYGVYLVNEDPSLQDFTKDAERQWNRALVDAYQSRVREWDWDLDDAAHGYALEMIVSHMIRGKMYDAAVNLLTDKSFIRGRLKSLGRENCTKRFIKDCELLFKKLKSKEKEPRASKLRARSVMKRIYQALGRELTINVEKNAQDERVKNVEVARSHYEIGFSLAENRCWDAAVSHWESSQELLTLALGAVEVVAGILYNIGVVYSKLHEYEQALNSLKECLKIRIMTHGEDHVLYAQTIQKIGDVLLDMCDYHEAMESYNWALDVMYRAPDHHYIEIGEILDKKGMIHYSKGEVDEALQCHQEALRSKQQDLGEDHPELAETYQHIGNCLSDQGNIDDAIVHFEEAVRLKELNTEGVAENYADILTIEGILNNLDGNQKEGLECYERALQILVTEAPHLQEKVASLLHLIGCVYLMSGEQTKAMKLFKESLKARRKVLGFIHLDVASTLFNMAFLHQTRNHLDKALRCLEEALKIRQLRLPESEKVAVTHEKIGSLARGMGKAKKAQIAFEEALKIRKAIHGEQHEAVAAILQELGDLMDDLGEYESAMSFYMEALEIRRNRLGVDDIAVSETLYSMGYTLHNSGESERALSCFVEALSIRRYRIGEDSMEVGDTLNMMGFLKAKRGELDDALTLLWDALRIRKLLDDHIKVSETLKNIGNVHREKEELDLAIECYEESSRIRTREVGRDHEKVADVLVAMGNVYSENPLHLEDARRSYGQAMDIRRRLFGNYDEGVAAVLQSLGTVEYRSKHRDRARDILSQCVKIRRENGTHIDGDYVNVLVMIGNIYKDEGKDKIAREVWNEAYQVFSERGLAETNPKIKAAMDHLVEEEKIDKDLYSKDLSSLNNNKSKSIFGLVSEILVKKDKPDDDSLRQNAGRKNIRRLKGKGFKL